jgi:hypothetical protein
MSTDHRDHGAWVGVADPALQFRRPSRTDGVLVCMTMSRTHVTIATVVDVQVLGWSIDEVLRTRSWLPLSRPGRYQKDQTSRLAW